MSAEHDVTASRRYVAVTFGELAAWHACGETCLLRSRLVDIPVADPASEEPAKDGDAARMLLRRLPPLALDDEEGVLIARLSPGTLDEVADDSQLARVPIAKLDALVPLTTRAQQILEDRLAEYGMALQKPWFQDVYRKVSCAKRIQLAIRAANALVEVFCPDVEWEVTDGLRAAAEQALVRTDFEDGSGVWLAREPVPTTWVSVAFGWTRRAPDGKGAVGDLYDAGVVLKQLGGQLDSTAFGDALERLRSYAKSFKTKVGDAHVGIREIVCSDEFGAAANGLRGAAPDAFPATLGTLVLYLRWQEHFHVAGPSIDTHGLSNDMRELSSAAAGDVVAAALWLLGFYAGCERIMPLKYVTQHQTPSWFRDRMGRVSVYRFKPAASEPTADAAIPGKMSDSVVACSGAESAPPEPEAALQNSGSSPAAECGPPEAISRDGAIQATVPPEVAGEEAATGPHVAHEALSTASSPHNAADDSTPPIPKPGETGSRLPESTVAAGGSSDGARGESRGSASSGRTRGGNGNTKKGKPGGGETKTS